MADALGKRIVVLKAPQAPKLPKFLEAREVINFEEALAPSGSKPIVLFTSYRRNDSKAIAGRIDDHLRAEFGERNVFRDVDDILPGFEFFEHIKRALGRSDVVIAIVGPEWGRPFTAPQRGEDFVQLELEFALRHDIPIMPVLVEGAELPRREHLPESLRPLLRRQVARVDSGGDFKTQLRRLVSGVTAVAGLRAIAVREKALPEQGKPEAIATVGQSSSRANRRSIDDAVSAIFDRLQPSLQQTPLAEVVSSAADKIPRSIGDASIVEFLETLRKETFYLWPLLVGLQDKQTVISTDIKLSTLTRVKPALEGLASIGLLTYSSVESHQTGEKREQVLKIRVECIAPKIIDMAKLIERIAPPRVNEQFEWENSIHDGEA